MGHDPVRNGRVVTGENVDSIGRNTKRSTQLKRDTHRNPYLCIYVKPAHVACFEEIENLR